MKKWLVGFVLCLYTCFGQNLHAQTLTHPEKVYINPPGNGGDDALRIDGGLKAGLGGSVTVINADGTLAIPSSSIADGSIAKIKLANDCTNGQVLVRNTSGSAPFWDCGATGSGIAATDNNITVTGTGWRFQNATVFGSSVTAQELIHVYNSGGDAGIQVQNNTQPWKLLATGSQFRIQSGTNYPLSLQNTQIGLFNTSPTAGYEVDLTGDLRVSGNNLFLGTYGNHVIPSSTDALDIGSYSVKWRNLFTSSLIFDQFVQSNVQLYNGYQIIGKSSGALNASINTSVTSFDADESLTIGDFLLFRGRDAGGNFSTEYMVITNKSGAGPYTYTVTRNLDGSGANSWNADTPFLDLGKQYDGRIELYAASGIPTIRTVIQGSTYNASTSLVHLGGLDGITGVDSARYGIYIGKNDGTGDYLKYQNYLGSPTGDDGVLRVKGSIVAGSYLVSQSAIVLDSGGLDVGTAGRVRGGKPSYGSSTAGFWLGYDSTQYKFDLGNNSNYLRWDGTNLTINGGGTFSGALSAASGTFAGSLSAATGTFAGSLSAASGTFTGTLSGGTVTGGTIQTVASCGSAGVGCLKVASNTLNWYDSGNNVLGTIDGNGISIPVTPDLSTPAKSYSFATSETGTSINVFGIQTGGYTISWLRSSNLYAGRNNNASAGLLASATNSSGTSYTSGRILAVSGPSFSGAYVDQGSFRVWDGSTTYFHVNGSDSGTPGNVGIGTSSPGQKLTIYDTSDAALTLQYSGQQLWWLRANRAGYFDIGGNGTNPSSGAIAIHYTGNVSIGTASPGSWKFLIDGAYGNTGQYDGDADIVNQAIVADSGKTGMLTFTESGVANRWVIKSPNGDSSLYFSSGSSTSNTTRVTFDTNGVVSANGFYVTNWQPGSGEYVCTDVTNAGDDNYIYYSTSACVSSSIRYKQDIVPATQDWKMVLDIPIVEFAYKKRPNVRVLGAIAEDVEDLGLLPLVFYNPDGQIQGINYEKIALYLIPIVKEQQSRIDDLEKRLDLLENKH